jgi:putative membrane protein
MKFLLRTYIYEFFALWVIRTIFPDSFLLSGRWENILFVAALLSVFELMVKPVLKLLFFPINLASLGTFSIFLTALNLYGLDYFLQDFAIANYMFPGLFEFHITIPAYEVGYIGTLLLISVSILAINKFLHFLANE